MSLNLLPVSMVMELNDIIFFLKSLRTPSSTFNILGLQFLQLFYTRSSSSHKLRHSCSSTTLSSHFYFSRLPRLWNSLLHSTFLYPQLSHIKTYFWSHFIDNFNTSDLCSFHILSCPCSKCIYSFSNYPNFTS